jgi:hypothetical protein
MEDGPLLAVAQEQFDLFIANDCGIGDSGEAERLFRREAERHSGMMPNTCDSP